MQKSRKFLIGSFILLFIAQYFEFGSTPFSIPYTTEGMYGMTTYNRFDVAQNGWSYKSWWCGAIMIGVILMFFAKPWPRAYYWAALVVCILFGFGSGFGGTLGFIAMLGTGYAVYLKKKEMLPATVPNKDTTVV